MKPIPSANAKSLRRFLSRTTFPRYPVEDDSISEVMSRIMAVTASQRLMSDRDSGKCISLYSFIIWYETSVVSVSGLNFNVFIVTAFPVVLAIAHVIALTKGHPSEYTLFKPSSR